MRVHARNAVGIAHRISREPFLIDRTMQHAVIDRPPLLSALNTPLGAID
jgi:hypothetical protein